MCANTCRKSTIKAAGNVHKRCFSVFIVDFEQPFTHRALSLLSVNMIKYNPTFFRSLHKGGYKALYNSKEKHEKRIQNPAKHLTLSFFDKMDYFCKCYFYYFCVNSIIDAWQGS